MAILYALVARGSVVLAEYSPTTTTANAIARKILEKIPGNNDTNVSYSQDRYIFHVKRTDGLTVLCMADDTAGRMYNLFRIFCENLFFAWALNDLGMWILCEIFCNWRFDFEIEGFEFGLWIIIVKKCCFCDIVGWLFIGTCRLDCGFFWLNSIWILENFSFEVIFWF